MPGTELTVTDAGRGMVELPGTVWIEWALHPGGEHGIRSAYRYRLARQRIATYGLVVQIRPQTHRCVGPTHVTDFELVISVDVTDARR
jgi:hypothetical protein